MTLTVTLRVKGSDPLIEKIVKKMTEMEADLPTLEEVFLILLSKKSKATEEDIRELAEFLEAKSWERLEKELL